jgi:broad specificity phosphatase PhoE
MKIPSVCAFTLIRRGETERNSTGCWQGQPDMPLSAAGHAQAARLERRLTALQRSVFECLS